MAEHNAEDRDVALLDGDPIIREAKDRWDRCSEWESSARERFLDDLKFANGDSDNGYQWPNAIRRARDTDSKPCLTMNIINQHNLQIANQARQNKSAIKIVATGGGGTPEAASIWRMIVRQIEYQSNAQAAYQMAREFQIAGGIGWWRLLTRYVDNSTFDQEIFIDEVIDPLSVYGDCDCQKSDQSDSNYSFVFDNIPESQFDKLFPKYKGLKTQMPLGVGATDDDWITKDHVRVCEYFRKILKPDLLISFVVPQTGERKTIKKSLLPAEAVDEILDLKLTRSREIEEERIEWKLIAGEEVIDETVWPGKYIPLIRVIGKETRIEGILDRKGHTRSMKDAQRMYNYNASSQVEHVALQGKTPWVASVKAIEEHESIWNTANIINHAILPYNHIDEEFPDKPIPPPQRTEPPNNSPAYQAGMETAFNQMMMTSGQWQNSMGMMGNERTGKAISERQQQSDTSVFHFEDNYAEALRWTGKQIIQLVPIVYNTSRIKMLFADDGEQMEVQVDPSAAKALEVKKDAQGKALARIFNPRIGMYDVAADVGPAYATKRQQTTEALTLILTQNPGLTGLIGDLLLMCMDFDEAQEAARRMKRMVPPQALGVGPTMQEQKLQQQIQALTGALTKALQGKAKDSLKLVGKDQMRDIDVYNAETGRMKALTDLLPMDQGGLEQIIHQLVGDSVQTHLQPIIDANASGLDGQSEGSLGPGDSSGLQMPPAPGARMAPDGQWYLSDPTRRGRYLRIAPLAQERSSRGVIANG